MTVLSAHDSDFYFGFGTPAAEYFRSYVSARNEGSALGLLAREARSQGNDDALDTLAAWGHAYAERAKSCDSPVSCSYAPGTKGRDLPPASKEAQLHQWGVAQGMQPAIKPATFPPGIRGCAAAIDLRPGDNAIMVPEACMIGVDTVVYPSSAGKIYQAIRDRFGLDDDTILMFW